MGAVVRHGTPLVEDPDRVGSVGHWGSTRPPSLGQPEHSTVYVTGMVDLDARGV